MIKFRVVPFLLAAAASIYGQQSVQPNSKPSFVKVFVREFWSDQKVFLTTPLHMSGRQFATEFLPLAGSTTALTFGDTSASRFAARRPDLRHVGNVISQAGSAYSLLGLTALTGTWAYTTHHPVEGHMVWNAVLTLADTQVDRLGLVAMLQRERPEVHNARGDFWAGGSSFPTGHGMSTWGMASAVAHTPGCKRWVAITLYSAAAAVSFGRWASLKHFPADILAGGVLGFWEGRSVARRHPYVPGEP